MKSYKNQSRLLNTRIQALEIKKEQDLIALKVELNSVYNELRPSRLIKRAVTDAVEAPEIRENLIESIISLAGGYISKKLLVGKSKSVYKKILGFALQYISTKIISDKFKK